MSDSIIDYGAPPINEVAVGVRFAPDRPITIPYFGLFWAGIRDDFPQTEHAAPLTDGTDLALDAASGAPLPRVWLVNSSGHEVIQLQPNAFLFNWRRRSDGDEYPRFSYVIERFNHFYQQWGSVLSGLGISIRPTRAQLTYVNLIPQQDGWSSWDRIGNVFPDFVWREGPRYLPAPSEAGFQVGFAMDEERDTLVMRMQPAIKRGEKSPLARLEILAQRQCDGEESEEVLAAWFITAREWIVRGFADITSEHIQLTQWKKG